MGFRFLGKAVIFSAQGVLEVLLVFLGISKRGLMILRANIHVSSFLLYVVAHYPIALSILAFLILYALQHRVWSCGGDTSASL